MLGVNPSFWRSGNTQLQVGRPQRVRGARRFEHARRQSSTFLRSNCLGFIRFAEVPEESAQAFGGIEGDWVVAAEFVPTIL